MPEEHKVYELIENERKERRQDIGEIHSRIDQILEAVNNISKPRNNGEASWVRQSVGLTIAVIALVGFLVPTMVAIVKPMQQQISALAIRADEHISKDGHPVYHGATLKTHNIRLNKLEDWRTWWHKSLLSTEIKRRGIIE